MSDAEQPPQCHTLGCENKAVEAGYCTECAEISPGVLDHQPDESEASSDRPQNDDDRDPDITVLSRGHQPNTRLVIESLHTSQ